MRCRRSLGFVCEVMERRVLLASDLSFALPQTAPVSGAAGPIYAGRFHGNSGATDLAISTGSSVQILNGSGNGTFTAGQSIALPSNPAAGKPFLVGDFRGTGNPDIVLLSQSVITGDGLISFETGTGSGSFVSGASSTIDDNGAGFAPITAAVGDFNGDGAADLAVIGKPVTGSGLVLAILASDTDGTFTETEDYPVTGAATSGTPLDEPLVAGVFAGSHVDIALDDGSSGHLDLFLNNGDGSFTPQTPIGLSATLISSAQLTGSGHLDLVAALGAGVTPLLGSGDGTFTTGTTVMLSGTVTALATGDMDLDGNRDVVTNAGILTGLGDGRFASTVTPLPVALGGGGTVSNTLLAADLTGDGRPDLGGFTASGGQLVTLINTTAAATVTSVNSADEPANPGDDVMLTATVSSALTSPVPTGQVSFYDAATLIGTAGLGLGGKATFDAGTGFTLGAHPIMAVYAGSASFAGSSSAVFTQDVLAPTATVLTSNENPANAGDPLTFTAVVSGNDGQGDIPSGQVEFLNGSTPLGSVALDGSGMAKFVYPSFTAGTSASVSAVYQGDDLFALSASDTINQAVQAAPLLPVVATSTVAGTVVAGTAIMRGSARVVVTNQTAQLISGPIEVELFLSTAAYIGSDAVQVSTFVKSVKLKAHASASIVVPIKSLPASISDGAYLLLARATIGTGVHSISNTGYGTQGPAIDVTAADASLAGALETRGLLSGSVGGTPSRASAAVTLKDIGNVPVKGPVQIHLWLSQTAGSAEISVGTISRGVSLKPGGSQKISIPFKRLPEVNDGAYYAVAEITGPGSQSEIITSEGTTQLNAPVILLRVTVGAVKGRGLRGRPNSVVISVANDGNIAASGVATISLQLSPAAGGSTLPVATLSRSITIGPNAQKTFPLIFTLLDSFPIGGFFPVVSFVEAGVTASGVGDTPYSIIG